MRVLPPSAVQLHMALQI